MKRRDFFLRGITAAGGIALFGCLPRTPGALEAAGDAPMRLPTAGTTYYVRQAGSDENSGTSPDRAWRTIDRVNAKMLAPGDTVLFEGGSSFRGTIRPTRSGSATNPITFRSFGWGRATITRAADDVATHGCHLEDVSHITVADLDFDGIDRAHGDASGVRAYALNAPMRGITVRDCDISNFAACGIDCGSSAAGRFSDLTVDRVVVSRCRGSAGIYLTNKSSAEERDFTMFRNVVIRDCRVRDMIGDGWGWSGSGITVFWTTDLLIEYCEVSETGLGSGTSGGGPVGIWVAAVSNGTIQFCESHHNRSNGTYDGGGFDLDGGSRNCTVQYCYSHDNEGAGYAVNYFRGGPTTIKNVVRFCISENDGRGISALGSGFVLWNQDNTAEDLRDTQIYGNTFYAEAGGRGVAVVRMLSVTDATILRNNILVGGSGTPLLRAVDESGTTFQGNTYHAPGGQFVAEWGSPTYHSLKEWRDGTGQERLAGQEVGLESDPRLIQAGGGGTVGDPRSLSVMTSYRLKRDSPAPNAGVDLLALGVSIGERDFFGNRLPNIGAYTAVGAASDVEASAGVRAGERAAVNW